MKPIREYIDEVQEQYLRDRKNDKSLYIIDWSKLLQQAGYYHAVPGVAPWNEIHEWCAEHIGEQHYAWVGNDFYFEREQDAIHFILRWA